MSLTESVGCLPAGETWSSATIYWGDGTTSPRTITSASSLSPEGGIAHVTVTGQHTYSQPGSFSIWIAVSNQAGQVYEGGWHTNAVISPSSAPFPEGTGPTGIVEAPYIGAIGGQLKEIAIEEEQRRAKEREEQQAKEAADRPVTEQPRGEEQPPTAHTQTEHPACRVPTLRGDTLTAARRALAKAHCRLGAVHRPTHHHGTMRVSAQGAPAGEQLAHGARVALWVGAKRASRRG